MSTKDYLSALDPPNGLRVPLRPQEFRFRSRTPSPSYGLVFSLTLFVLLGSFSALSAGQNCTPVFEGSQIGVSSQEEPKSVIKVVEGASFNLTCTLSQLNNFEWRLNKSSTPVLDANHFKIKPHIRKGGVVLMEMYVTNVTRNHSGEFTCIVSGCQSSDVPHHGLTVKVIYAEKPKIIHPKRNNYSEVFAEIGEDLEIRCESKEDVHEGVIWQREVRHETSSKWENMESICKKKNSTAVTSKKKSTCYIEEKLENKTKLLTLVLNNTRQEDLVNYSCGIPIPNGAASSEIEMQKNDFISLRAGRSKQNRVKRWVKPPPKYEGVYPYPKGYENVQIGSDVNEKLKIIRKFEKGMNSTIAMEGDPVLLYCNLIRGNDPDYLRNQYKVAWRLTNNTYFHGDNLMNIHQKYNNYNYTESPNTTTVKILSAKASDKGWYQCSLWDSHQGNFKPEYILVTFEIRLRIREKLTPLYPFISICVEIVIVFLIILIYEKSKSKTEVDESDTDGSPDQKNVSDNGDGGGSEGTRLAGKE